MLFSDRCKKAACGIVDADLPDLKTCLDTMGRSGITQM